MSHGLLRGPPWFLNSYWSVGAAESNLSPWLGQWFMSKGLHREIQGVVQTVYLQMFLSLFKQFKAMLPAARRWICAFLPHCFRICWFLMFSSENSIKHINLINHSVKKNPVRESRLYLCLLLFETLKGEEKKDIRCVWVIVLRLRNCNCTREKNLLP